MGLTEANAKGAIYGGSRRRGLQRRASSLRRYNWASPNTVGGWRKCRDTRHIYLLPVRPIPFRAMRTKLERESARLGPGRRRRGATARSKNAPCDRCRLEAAGHRLHISCDKSLLESNLFVLKPETLEDVVGSRGSIPWMGGIAREVHDGREGNGGAVQIIWLHRILIILH